MMNTSRINEFTNHDIMKFLFSLISIIVLGGIVQMFLPWWSLVVVAFLVAFAFRLNAWQGFFAGFLGIFLLWAGYAFLLNQANEGILASRMSDLFSLSGGATSILIISALIGGLVGGLGAATGGLGRQLIKSKGESNQ